MAADKHILRGHPIVTGLIIFFGLIEVAISSWLTARYGMKHDAPNSGILTRTHFILFCSVWTIIFTAIFGLLFFHSATGSVLTSVMSHGVFFLLTWLFWTAAAASITAALGGGLNCKHSPFPYCGQLNAMEAFAWIEWILITFALIVVLIRGISASKRGDGMRGGLIV